MRTTSILSAATLLTACSGWRSRGWFDRPASSGARKAQREKVSFFLAPVLLIDWCTELGDETGSADGK
jgi:hypothetical protein